MGLYNCFNRKQPCPHYMADVFRKKRKVIFSYSSLKTKWINGNLPQTGWLCYFAKVFIYTKTFLITKNIYHTQMYLLNQYLHLYIWDLYELSFWYLLSNTNNTENNYLILPRDTYKRGLYPKNIYPALKWRLGG